MSDSTYEVRLAEALIPLALQAVKTTARLHNWREDAGAKKTWSNHARLTETSLYAKVEEAFAILEDALHKEIPDHWNMKDWAFRPSRMGTTVRWAAKGGTARNRGITFQTKKYDFLQTIGTIVGAITRSRKPSQAERSRLSSLGLTTTEVSKFSFQTQRCLLEASGCYPRDAYALLLVQGQIGKPAPPPASARSSYMSAFQSGIDWAAISLSSNHAWSVAPTLYPRLRKDSRVHKLAGPGPKFSFYVPPWHEHNREIYDQTLTLALTLLESLDKKSGKMKNFLVDFGGGTLVEAKGWCATSAILGCVVRRLDEGKLTTGIKTWRIFSANDDLGSNARKIAPDFTLNS